MAFAPLGRLFLFAQDAWLLIETPAAALGEYLILLNLLIEALECVFERLITIKNYGGHARSPLPSSQLDESAMAAVNQSAYFTTRRPQVKTVGYHGCISGFWRVVGAVPAGIESVTENSSQIGIKRSAPARRVYDIVCKWRSG
jgi:hypothetical protein